MFEKSITFVKSYKLLILISVLKLNYDHIKELFNDSCFWNYATDN
jgi:hypothetical protein